MHKSQEDRYSTPIPPVCASILVLVLAGLSPVVLLCQRMNPDGTMMRGIAIERCAELHDMLIPTSAEMIAWRKQQASQVAPCGRPSLTWR